MSGEIGSAFVRIKADLRGFREEVNAGVKSSLRAAGTVGAGASTARQREQLLALGATSNRVAAEQVAASRRVRSAREQEARSSVAAEIRERRSLSEQVVGYRRVAAAARAGSETQIVANRLAADSATRLGIPLSRTEQHAARAHGSLNKLERGAIAGSGAFRGLGRNIAYSSLSFIGAYGFINVAKGALDQVGNLNTEQTRSTTVFGRNGRAVREWAQQAGRGLGYSKSSALEAANAFGTLFRAADIAPKKAGKFAEDFTRLGAALSLSRGETDPANAERALQTGLSGRGRGLRAYGIILDQTSIKAEAFRLGLVKSDVDTGKVSLAQRRLAEAQVALVETRAKAAAGKASPLQVARAEDAVTVAQGNLKKALAGSTVELTAQEKAVAAHSLVMSQGQHFIDRYGASLKSDAGQSRRFHEGISELKEELGKALYPSFKKAREGVINWIDSVREGGPKHKQFVHDLHDIGQAAKFIYQSLRLLARGAGLASDAVGGFGNAIKIAALLYGANKFLTLAHAIRESRLALLLLGGAGRSTTGGIVRDAERMAGGFNAPIGKVGRLRAMLRGLASSKVAIAATVFIGYEFIKGEAKILRKLFGLSADDGVHGGDTSTFLGIPGLGSGSAAHDVQGRGGNPYPVGTSAHAIFEAAKAGKGRRNIPIPGSSDTNTVDATSGRAAEAYRRGRAARKKAEEADKADNARNAKDRAKTAKDEGKNTADIYASTMKDELAQKRKEIQQQLAQTTADLVQARKDASREIRAAVQEAHQAERDAVLQAKSNLNSLGSSLASQVGQLIDKQAERQSQAPSGPLVARLKRLNALIHAGKGTPEVIAEAKRVENEINQQERIHSKDTEKRKERVTRRLADLTDELNTGKISLRKFNREVTALLRREGVSYRAAGRALGISFADGFRVALRELRAQARAIAQTPARLRRLGTGFETQIIRPLQVLRQQEANVARVEHEQNARIAEAAKAQRKALLEAQKLGVHATRKAGQDVVRAVHQSTGGRKEKPKPSPKRPTRDLTDTLLGQVVRQERTGNSLERSEIALARNQRGTQIREQRRATKVLERIANQGEQELREIREVKRELRPRPGGGNKNPRTASREANATASHNLLGS